MNLGIRDNILYKCVLDEGETELIIPDGVKHIYSYCFQNCNKITSVVLPNGLETIDYFAFAGCTSLVDIQFPDSISYIYPGALDDTAWYERQIGDFVMPTPHYLYAYKGPMNGDIVIPESVRYIGDRVFSGMNAISSVKLPEGLKSLGSRAFIDCRQLTSIDLPKGLKSIGYQCFAQCHELKHITIPEKPENVEINAFTGTKWLNEYQGDFVIMGDILLKYIGSGGDIVVPDGIRVICDSALNNKEHVTSIIIPEGVEEIGGALCFGKKVERVVIPSTLKKWYGRAFVLSVIEHLQINFSVKKSIYEVMQDKEDTISECTIKRIYAPNIPISAMGALKREAAVSFAEMWMEGYEFPKKYAEEYKQYIRNQRLKLYGFVAKSDKFAEYLCSEKVIPLGHIDRVLELVDENLAVKAMLLEYRNNNFSVNDMEKQMIRDMNKDPYSITEMKMIWGYKVLPDDTLMITSYKGDGGAVDIPYAIGKRRVTAIGKKVFDERTARNDAIRIGRSKVSSITIPDTITTISDDAFYHAAGIEKIRIPDSVTYLGKSAFFGCKKLKSVTISGSIKTIESCCFNLCPELLKVVVEEGVEALELMVFAGCNSLMGIWLPASVKTIKGFCFEGCHGLVIYAPKGSYAIQHAIEQRIKYIEI